MSIQGLFATYPTALGFYCKNDLNSFFTDTAGTSAAAVGNNVRCWKDISGQSRHILSGSVTNTTWPTLRQDATTGRYYLDFDGGDWMLIASYQAVKATDGSATWGAAVQTANFTASPRILAMASTSGHPGEPMRLATSAASGVQTRPLASATITDSSPALAGTGVDFATTAVWSAPGGVPTAECFLNGASNGATTGSGTIGHGAEQVFVCSAFPGGSNMFTGRVYGLFGINVAVTATERADADAELASLFAAAGGKGFPFDTQRGRMMNTLLTM